LSKIGGEQWSGWNIFDERENYYGNVVLNCDGTHKPTFVKYTKPKVNPDEPDQYCLKGFHVKDAPFQNSYRLEVDEVFGVLNPTLAKPALYQGTNQPIWLSTKDGTIVNDKRNVVVLKGIARPSLEWNVNGQYLSSSDIATMSTKWSANVIRISLNQAFWLASAPRETFGSYKQIVDAMIYYAIQQKIAVILDLHIIKSVPPGGHAVPDNMANEDSIHFWQDIARTYATFGTVLFELYNEPKPAITQQQWLNGGGPHVAGEGPYVGYQQLYEAVRGAGANNLCIVAGTDWGYDLSFVNDKFGVQGTGIVYCSHPWWPRGKDNSMLASNFKGVLGKFPVIFTEFGCNDWASYDKPSDHPYEDYYRQIIKYVNDNGIHYAAWGWWVENYNKPHPPPPAQPMPGLLEDWTGNPSMGGVIIKDDLNDKPGRGIG